MRYLAWSLTYLLVSSAHGDLADSNFRDLLNGSELVVTGLVHNTDIASCKGSAAIKPRETVKGVPYNELISIEFTGEIHDQCDIREGELRLFFLKKDEHQHWKGTHYGRSYWPLYKIKGSPNSVATPYEYPIATVVFKGEDLPLLSLADFEPPLEYNFVARILQFFVPAQMIRLDGITRRLEKTRNGN